MTAAPDIVIFVRHSEGCKYTGDDFARRCDCRKHFRWTANGKRYRQPAGTRSWAQAEVLKAELLSRLTGNGTPASDDKNIMDAVDVFVKDKTVQGVSKGVVDRYKSELARFVEFCSGAGIYNVRGISREIMTDYAATWDRYDSTNTRALARKMLRSFLRYCYEAQWLPRIPQVPRITVNEVPTLPLGPGEYERVLGFLDRPGVLRLTLREKTWPLKDETRIRLRALVELMRWSGLAIQDAVKISFADIQGGDGLYRVVTARQKTNVPVSVPLPPAVAEELLAVPPTSPGHPFWTRQSERASVKMWGKIVRALFETAGIQSGHMISHRLRDTFAVDLLTKGVPLEDVSKLLGHTSIKTTEAHYAPWIQGRQNRLDSLVMGTWAPLRKVEKANHRAG
jgi:integrase/recombinase XerD